MKTYLKYGNPILAVVVFALCTFASMKDSDDKTWEVGGMFKGGIPTYFFAKGIFCGTAMFLLGKLLERELEK
ncbi:MAG: hypothetical protein ACYTFI_22210 [Planctomycetota bacterium]|jgi:hypothetical protein